MPLDRLGQLGALVVSWAAPQAQAACNLIPAAESRHPTG
jgi:hypothetical protein